MENDIIELIKGKTGDGMSMKSLENAMLVDSKNQNTLSTYIRVDNRSPEEKKISKLPRKYQRGW